MEKPEKPLKKKKKSKIGFMIFLLIAFAVCLIVNYVASYDSRLDTMIVRSGSEEDIIEGEGFVFRGQTTVSATDGGYVYCVADEDQRVRSGEAVVHIYKNDINMQANNDLEEIEKEIKKYSEAEQMHNLPVTDSAKIEQNISKLMRTVPAAGYNSDFEGVAVIKDQINEFIEDKRIAAGEITPEQSTAVLERLQKKKAEIEAQYNIEKSVVYAPVSGAFTSKIDGLETRLGYEALDEISVSYVESLKNVSVSNLSKTKVETGDFVGKIVDNFKWSVAVVVAENEVEDVKVGRGVEIRFTDISIEPVEGTVTKIVPDGKGKAVVVVESKAYVDMIYSTSITNVQIIKKKYEGFRVPAESIRMVDGKTGVYVVKNNKSRYVPVSILYNNDDWVIISERITDGVATIKLYDELIISGRNLYDNKVVR